MGSVSSLVWAGERFELFQFFVFCIYLCVFVGAGVAGVAREDGFLVYTGWKLIDVSSEISV